MVFLIMFEYLKGVLTEAAPSQAVIDIHGLGYAVLIPLNLYSKLPPIGSVVTLYVSFVSREDSQRLFGFLTKKDREFFESLIAISGIGPKIALALLGHMEMGDLQMAIVQNQTQEICKVPGIGKKTAERLVVEMRDKIKKLDLPHAASGVERSTENELAEDALSALMNLGYHGNQAKKAVDTVMSQKDGTINLAQLITTALRHL